MRYIFALSAAALAGPVLAEDGAAVSGSSRLRYETIARQPRAGFDDADTLVNLRTTLAIDYRAGPWQVSGELWDSRVYNADAGTPLTTNEVNAIEPVQAFVRYDAGDVLGRRTKLAVQAGRFLLNLGSRRLVAADDYRNTTNGYTGLRVDLNARGGIDATLIYTLPQIRRPDDFAALAENRVKLDSESFDLVLWGGLAAKRNALGTTTAELSFYHLGERDAPGRPTRDRQLDTVALRVIREPKAGQWDHEAEVIRQTGHARDSLAATALRRRVSAWFVHADSGYTFATRWKPRLSLEFDYASGDRRGDRFTRFDSLFGMRRADLAPAGLYNAVGRTNLLTPAVRIEATPSPRVDAFATYRPMWLASRTDTFSTTGVRDAAGRSGRFAGHQLEARVRWWLRPGRLRLEANGVLLVKGRFLETAPNAPRGGDTRYLSLNATASF